jgi:hypothetical protein
MIDKFNNACIYEGEGNFSLEGAVSSRGLHSPNDNAANFSHLLIGWRDS